MRSPKRARAASRAQDGAYKAWEERGAGLTARLTDQDAHRQSLEQKHSQARDALKHFRQSAKGQRDTESRRYEHQVQTLGQQRVETIQECDRLRTEVDRYAVGLAAERQARRVEADEQSRRETRLQSIEELLAQIKEQSMKTAHSGNAANDAT